jgi:hypothetical protein
VTASNRQSLRYSGEEQLPTIHQTNNLGATNRKHGRRQDYHRIVLRMLPHDRNSWTQYTNTPVTDPRHRIYPRYPLLRPLPQLPHPARGRNLRACARAKLDMQQGTSK